MHGIIIAIILTLTEFAQLGNGHLLLIRSGNKTYIKHHVHGLYNRARSKYLNTIEIINAGKLDFLLLFDPYEKWFH